MLNSYDIIIIGAGPAGLSCAAKLAHSDKRVLVIDSFSLKYEKPCAGGITDYYDKFYKKIDKCCKENDLKNIEIFNEILVKNQKPIKIINRKQLRIWQYNKLKDFSNVDFIFNNTVKRVCSDKIIDSNGKSYYFKYLVGADGCFSIVRKYLGLKNYYKMGIYYEIEGFWDYVSWDIKYSLNSFTYFWTFPHKGYLNIGFYFDPAYLKFSKAQEFLKDYIVNKKGFKLNSSALKGGFLNVLYQGWRFENIFLIGEAAGLVVSGTGEGINFAVLSGEEVALKILDKKYHTPHLQKIIKHKKRIDYLIHLYKKILLKKIAIDFFIKLMKLPAFLRFFRTGKFRKRNAKNYFKILFILYIFISIIL